MPKQDVEALRSIVVGSTRLSGLVKRFHVWPCTRIQTVAEHCWQVSRIHDEVFGPAPAHVERYIRYHDCAELIVGDVPYPVKAQAPELKAAYDELEVGALQRLGIDLPELNSIEKVRVKICDWLDLTELGMEERERGNLMAVPIILHTEQAVLQMANDKLSSSDANRVHAYVRKLWVRHKQVLGLGELQNYVEYGV